MDRAALTLGPFSCPHSQQPGSNEADSYWNSHSVPLQQFTGSRAGEGGKGCTCSDEPRVWVPDLAPSLISVS